MATMRCFRDAGRRVRLYNAPADFGTPPIGQAMIDGAGVRGSIVVLGTRAPRESIHQTPENAWYRRRAVGYHPFPPHHEQEPIGTMDSREALDLWRRALTEAVRREGPDLSARQMAILLTVYLTDPPHTVRGLAAHLNISKPAVTRALDRLGRLGFARRKIDATDRRNVLVQRTVKGSVFLSEFADLVRAAEKAPDAPSQSTG